MTATSLPPAAPSAPPLGRRLLGWVRTLGLARKLSVMLLIGALGSAIATYAAFIGLPPFGPDPAVVLWLLNLNLVLVLMLALVIARRFVEVWTERRRGQAGSRLQARLVVVFGVVAAAPAVIVAVFSALFMNYGLQGWFSERVRSAVTTSQEVALAYLSEHQQAIRGQILAMAQDLNREAPLLLTNAAQFQQLLQAQAAFRGLSEAIVIDGNGREVVRAGFVIGLAVDRMLPFALERARNGEVALIVSDSDDRVRAAVRLAAFSDVYLVVGRFVDPRAVQFLEQNQAAVETYLSLEGRRSEIQITFTLMFAVLALVLLLAAIWFGLMWATRLVRPISALMSASERVRAGDLAARVGESTDGDEIAQLSRAFNRMTEQLQAQRQALIQANQELDHRSRFTEAVLAGVSAGVIGLDRDGRINLPNRSASELLGEDLGEAVGQPLDVVVPEMGALLEQAHRRPDRVVEGQVRLVREKKARTLLVRIAADQALDAVPEPDTVLEDPSGFVVTFDDVTELLQAQRTAAWADVARRIAHEIKNPLTPIQLSAERLKRKYLKEIQSDPETFIECTSTIVRQVGDIGRMVDEFSAFARMPAPVMKEENLATLVREAVSLQRGADLGVTFTVEVPEAPVRLRCDARQVRQALTNLLQNALDAIDGRNEPNPPPGHVTVRVVDSGRTLALDVLDNGKGLPEGERDRLVEPYVTTRAKGTGLGLAIVKKIMEDHQGEVVLDDAPGGGARVRLIFTRADEQEPAEQAKAVSHGA
ncbi:MAG: PAS domain-containing sensor histidine kinase [Alphaproteobacteria bacterium]|nr:MAG: PAS domain-containing sensor histidine kinase [Alphaproteobacteria bacterium]